MRADQERREKESVHGEEEEQMEFGTTEAARGSCCHCHWFQFKVGPSAFSLVLVQQLQPNLIKTFIFTLLISSLGSCLIM